VQPDDRWPRSVFPYPVRVIPDSNGVFIHGSKVIRVQVI
jgi:hypothetical protein